MPYLNRRLAHCFSVSQSTVTDIYSQEINTVQFFLSPAHVRNTWQRCTVHMGMEEILYTYIQLTSPLITISAKMSAIEKASPTFRPCIRQKP